MLFTGRLTANAEVKAFNDNKEVINFTVALNQKWKNKSGEKKEKTEFIDCAYWRNSGVGECLTKGAIVEISQWMEAQAYQSKKDGLRARLICTCDTINLFSFNAITGYFQNVKEYKDDEAKAKSIIGGTGQLRTQAAFDLCLGYAKQGAEALTLN